jgi:hypothetical protein
MDKLIRGAYQKGQAVRASLRGSILALKLRERTAFHEGMRLAEKAGLPQPERIRFAREYNAGVKGLPSPYGD